MVLEQNKVAVKVDGEIYLYTNDGYVYKPKQMNFDGLAGSNMYYDILEESSAIYREWGKKITKYMPFFKGIPLHFDNQTMRPTQPFWLNDWFPPFDAIATYTILAERQPNIYLEIGSGNSTKFARKAIDDHHLPTQIISIDPYPRVEIDDLCHEIIRKPLEDVDLSLFSSLRSGDVLFIDSSHRALQGSDVTVFFTKILPIIPKGVLWGLHDIFLPFDYPQEWVSRLYNEQYLLMLYLLGGHNRDEIEIPVCFMTHFMDIAQKLHEAGLKECGLSIDLIIGGSFWMER